MRIDGAFEAMQRGSWIMLLPEIQTMLQGDHLGSQIADPTPQCRPVQRSFIDGGLTLGSDVTSYDSRHLADA